MSTSTISALALASAGNFDDTAAFPIDDKNGNTRRVTPAMVRTQLNSADQLHPDGLYDDGKSGASRLRDIFASRDITAGRNLSVGGIVTHAGVVTASGGPTTMNTGVANTVYTPSVPGTYLLSAENAGSGSPFLMICSVFRYDGTSTNKMVNGDGGNLTSGAAGVAIQITYGGGFGASRDIRWTIERIGNTSW